MNWRLTEWESQLDWEIRKMEPRPVPPNFHWDCLAYAALFLAAMVVVGMVGCGPDPREAIFVPLGDPRLPILWPPDDIHPEIVYVVDGPRYPYQVQWYRGEQPVPPPTYVLSNAAWDEEPDQ